ncbi:hypothetical protein RJ639_014512 [Escallonia herrerae]|uniref:Pentatricopeptide repeat-containing protein n=1 Tax=Escallonia herrerae TaxID=1293975 RepID=A0AA88VGH1_9ASTE|nr:hypothetical protein RJ639_014512 [Escallonia herrerae]
MSTSLAARHSRHLSSLAAASVTTATTPSVSISKAKSKLRSEHDPDKALELYSSISTHYTSPVSSRYAQDLTIKRLVRSRRFSDIEALIESHKTDPKITQEPFLTTLIRSYGSAGMFAEALKTYNQMDELGAPRSAVSFNALLSAFTQSKQFDQVPKLFEEMPEKYGFAPDKYSYGILVKSYCLSGSPELAIERLKEMEEKGIEITTITLTTILHSLYKKGDVEEAERIWKDMAERGCLIDEGAYNVKIMHAQGGEPEDVKRLIEEMSDLGLKPDTISYNYLMTCYCRNGMMKEGMNVYEDLQVNGNGQFETGYKVFKKSVAAHKIPDVNTLKHLVNGLVKKGEMKNAKGLIRTVKKKFPPNLVNVWKKVEEELGSLVLSTKLCSMGWVRDRRESVYSGRAELRSAAPMSPISSASKVMPSVRVQFMNSRKTKATYIVTARAIIVS